MQSSGSEPGSAGDHHTSKLIRRLGCGGVLLLGVLSTVALLVRDYAPKDWFEKQDRLAVAASEANGVAASLPTFAKKYPANERGRKGVKEIARIVDGLIYNYKAYETTGSAVVVKRPHTGFDLQNILRNSVGAEISTATLLAYAAANTTQVADLLKVSNICSFDELSWEYGSFNEPPVFPSNFLRLRETARVLLPTEIYLALQDDDTTRAYSVLLNWMYIGQALEVSGTNLVSGMIGVALDGIMMHNAEELLRCAPPPSLEIARRLHDQVDPVRMQRDYIRCCEAEGMWFAEYLRFAAGTVSTPPATLRGSGVTPDFQKALGAMFAHEVVACWKDVSAFRMPSSYPNPMHLLWGTRGMTRAFLLQGLLGQIEWPQRVISAARAPDFPSLLKLVKEGEVWAESMATTNPVFAISAPAFLRATMNARGRQAEAAVVRAACMMRMAEMQTRDVNATMPVSLWDVSKLVGVPVPMDPLGMTAGAPVKFTAHPENGNYEITHSPSKAPYEGATPYVFKGKWAPGS